MIDTSEIDPFLDRAPDFDEAAAYADPPRPPFVADRRARRRSGRDRHPANLSACVRNRAAAPELDLRHLAKALRAQGLPHDASFHNQAPFRGFVESSDGQAVGGRFFPSRNAILVYRHQDDLITQATLNHELGHPDQYGKHCHGTDPSKRQHCAYTGQHDADFYRTVERLHRETGVPPAIARIPEGNYPYPARWNRDDAW